MDNTINSAIIQPSKTITCLGTTKYRTSRASVAKIKFDTMCIFFETMAKWFVRLIVTIFTLNQYKKLNTFQKLELMNYIKKKKFIKKIRLAKMKKKVLLYKMVGTQRV